MLTNPVITTKGACTWFATFAAAEVYESNLYEVAEDALLTVRGRPAVNYWSED